MKKNRQKNDHALLDARMDNELDSDERTGFDDHPDNCPTCRKEIEAYDKISSLYTKSLDQAAKNTDFSHMEQRLFDKLEKRKQPWWIRLGRLMGTGRVLIPATTFAALVLIFFFSMKPTPDTLGPSALVTSISGDYDSVMIMETPNEQQTIIWIQETTTL